MEKNLVDREVEEELNRTANRAGDGDGRIVKSFCGKSIDKNRLKPRRKSDQGDGENNIDR